MSFNVIYAARDKINDNTIPKESLILTDGANESEAFYYDHEGNLKQITKKTQFDSMNEALTWINKYDYQGEIISIHQDSQWVPYVVNDNKQPILIQDRYDVIDGGGVPN